MIPFDKPLIIGNELEYVKDAYKSLHTSGDGKYTFKCQELMENKFRVKKIFLTTSCTHALEMAAILLNIKPGDEVIMPSYTFVSTANAFVLRGAKPVFCDIREDNLNIDENKIERLITKKTKCIVPVHYGGVACDMDKIMEIAKKYNLYVVEDAAPSVNAKYKDKYLGSIGDIGCYSFHETKNYSMGEGGAIAINNKEFLERAEIIREKGTNRSQFLKGEIDKYCWIDIGSNYLASDINAAVLLAQLEKMDKILEKRKQCFDIYFNLLKPLEEKGLLRLPIINDYASSNYHIFYILLKNEEVRNKLMHYLRAKGICAVFHYTPLHESTYYKENYGNVSLPVTEDISRRILRLPLFYDLSEGEIKYICKELVNFMKGK